MPIAILVHGGAGPIAEDDRAAACAAGCLAAARIGHAVLRTGGSALDAVEAATRALEDDPLFNAGTGAALNAEGRVELDASIMNGADLSAGAVCAVRRIKHPVALARQVMERTPHVLLAADGAERLAAELGIPTCDEEELITERARRRWEAERAGAKPQVSHGTVGAVAVDDRGHVAAATSTGGTFGKRPGRVGDSPLIGAGNYADDRTGAASATGHGESIIKVVLAKFACDRLRIEAPTLAARAAIAELERVGGTGGIILASPSGALGFAFNTPRMSRASIDPQGREHAGFLP